MRWLALLAEASAAAATGAPPSPTTIDLLADPACSRSDNEVVVCGQTEDRRVRPLPAPPQPVGPPGGPLSIRLPGGGTGKLRAIQSDLPGGRGSGAAVTLSLPF